MASFQEWGAGMSEIIRLPSLWTHILRNPGKPLPYKKLAFGKHRKQYLLHFEAAKNVAAKDVVIYFIHGGGWHAGSPFYRKKVAELFTALGYDVILAAYRLAPMAGSVKMKQDTFEAFGLASSIEHLSQKKFVIIGESAGGNLGALLAYDRKSAKEFYIDRSRISAFVSSVGALDMDKLAYSFVVKNYCGSKDSDTFFQANAINHLETDEHIPLLAVHGTADGLVPYPSAASFVNKMNQLNPGMAELMTIEGGSHLSVGAGWFLEENEVWDRIRGWIELAEIRA